MVMGKCKQKVVKRLNTMSQILNLLPFVTLLSTFWLLQNPRNMLIHIPSFYYVDFFAKQNVAMQDPRNPG
jgi:hypothetical protein